MAYSGIKYSGASHKKNMSHISEQTALLLAILG